MRFIGKITDESTVGKDWSVHFDVPWSKWSQMTDPDPDDSSPKKCTLSKWVKISNKKIDMSTSTTIKRCSCLSHKACHGVPVASNLVFWLISFNLGCLVLTYNSGQILLRQIAKMPIFSFHPGKNWNHHQMNAWFPTSLFPKLFRIAWQLYTLVLDQDNFE